jgi:hypothetical protein
MFSVLRGQKGSALVIFSSLILIVALFSSTLGRFLGGSKAEDRSSQIRGDRLALQKTVRSFLSDPNLCVKLFALGKDNVLEADKIPRSWGYVQRSDFRFENRRFVFADLETADFVYEISCVRGEHGACIGKDRIPLLFQKTADGKKLEKCDLAIGQVTCESYGGKWQESSKSCDLCRGQWRDGLCI